MMGKTHVAMGVAVATLILNPIGLPSHLLAISGGALGGVAADIDTVKNDFEHDALIGQVLAAGILCASLFIDVLTGGEICSGILGRNIIVVLAGLVGYFALLIKGYRSEHRTFTHSIIALVLFTISISLVIPGITAAYAVGYTTHLVLDILNKKPVPIFYPKGKGIYLGWCYANRTANTWFMWIGFIGSIILILFR